MEKLPSLKDLELVQKEIDEELAKLYASDFYKNNMKYIDDNNSEEESHI